MNPSSTIARARPMVIPRAASASAQPTRVEAEMAAASIAGQREKSASVKPSERAMRAGWGTLRAPGRGTNTSAPDTRASTSRNPYRVPAENVRLTGIACEVAEEGGGVRDTSGQHPRKHQQQAQEKGEEPRNGAEGVVLHGGRDLHQADYETGDEPDRQQRGGEPEGRHQGLAHEEYDR